MDNTKDMSYSLISEGEAKIYQPSTVFYNPVQEFNRDLSVLALDTYLGNELWNRSKKCKKFENKPLNVLDALSASGLRGIRYAKELENINKINKIFINDYSKNAFQVMQNNINHNNVANKVQATNEDAVYLMYKSKFEEQKLICVDLDPYGCAGNFLDSLVQSTYDGGLLMVTATDVAILCGNTPETCFAKYGSMSLRSHFCHEMGLRIVLKSIETAALKYGRYIKPLLSLSIDFYVRIFVQIFTSPLEAKNGAERTSMVFYCNGCNNFELQKLCSLVKNKKSDCLKYVNSLGPVVDKKCSVCDTNYRVAGPVYNGKIHDFEFVEMLKKQLNTREENKNILQFNTHRRIKGILNVVSEELPDCPFFYSLKNFQKALKFEAIPAVKFRSAILNAGYEVSNSHSNPDSIKTNAPSNVIWDIVVSIVKNKKISNEVAKKILSRKVETNVSFEYNDKELQLSKKLGLLRYQQNPTKFWGPLSKPSNKNKTKSSELNTVNVNSEKSKKEDQKQTKREISENEVKKKLKIENIS